MQIFAADKSYTLGHSWILSAYLRTLTFWFLKHHQIQVVKDFYVTFLLLQFRIKLHYMPIVTIYIKLH